jgi:hypothetical protein
MKERKEGVGLNSKKKGEKSSRRDKAAHEKMSGYELLVFLFSVSYCFSLIRVILQSKQCNSFTPYDASY